MIHIQELSGQIDSVINYEMWCKSGLVFLIYIVVLNIFGVFIKLLEYTNLILQYNIKIETYNSKYDYIVGKFIKKLIIKLSYASVQRKVVCVLDM